MQIRELELQLIETMTRLEQVESDLDRIKNPLPIEWMNPAQVEEWSKGKYPASLVRKKVILAIECPADSPLKLGVHYVAGKNDRGWDIRVNYPLFDRMMVEEMRSNAFW